MLNTREDTSLTRFQHLPLHPERQTFVSNIQNNHAMPAVPQRIPHRVAPLSSVLRRRWILPKETPSHVLCTHCCYTFTTSSKINKYATRFLQWKFVAVKYNLAAFCFFSFLFRRILIVYIYISPRSLFSCHHFGSLQSPPSSMHPI